MLLLPFVLASMVGCATNNVAIGEPMPLEPTLLEIGEAIRSADAEAEGKKPTGLIPAEVTVNLVLTNTTEEGVEANIQAIPVPPATIGAGWAGSAKKVRGNTVTIVYKNYLLAGSDTIVGSSPEKASEALEGITTLRNLDR